MASQREWIIGKHRAHFEEPDLLIVSPGGAVGLEDAKSLTDLYREVGTRKPFFAIININHNVVDAEARSYLAKENRQEWFRGIIYVGAGLLQKGIVKALSIALYSTGRWMTELLFANTLEEARAIVQRERAKQSTGG